MAFDEETWGKGTSISGGLVINEIDYDQPGGDADEFVELMNTGRALSGWGRTTCGW